MTICLLTSLTGCGSSEEEYYGEEITYDEEWGADEETWNEDWSEEGEVLGASTETEEGGEEAVEDYSNGYPYEVEDLGLTLMLPEEYIDTQGMVQFDCTDVTDMEGIYYAQMNYYGIPYSEIETMFAADDISDEDALRFNNSIVPVFTIVAATGNRSIKDMIDYVKIGQEVDLVESGFNLIKTVDDCNFYRYDDGTPANYENIDDSLKSEYDHLVSLTDDILAKATFVRPVTGAEKMIGTEVSFETTDLDGNTVTSDEIFMNNEVTMVNVWATWCPCCIGELGELEAINKNLEGKNCAIVGLCSDAVEPAKIEEAKEILKEYGVTYYNLCAYDGWEDAFEMSGWPSSFFVGKEGKMVAAPIYGALVEKYEPYIDDILAGKATVMAKSNSTANKSGAYKFYVVDNAGNPIQGAMVQFCTDSTCKIQATDASGVATFNDPPGVYEIHVPVVPDGYAALDETYKTEDHYSDMVIVLDKK